MELAELPKAADFDAWEYLLPNAPGYSADYEVFSVYDHTKAEDVTAERIARVDAFYVSPYGDWNDQDVVALVALTDGSWAALTAWCDTTGWCCQSGAVWRWARTRDDAIRLGLDREGRHRLGVALPSDIAAVRPDTP